MEDWRMNRKVLATVIGGVALGAMALPAAAQTSKPVGLAIRAGVDFPTANGSNTTLFGAGLEYNLSNLSASSMGMGNGHITLSVDYFGRNNASVFPVLLNYVGSTSSPFYYTLGAGIAYDRLGGGNTNWNFAYRIGVGYNFSQSTTPVFLEADYFGNSNSNLNVIGVYLGIRL